MYLGRIVEEAKTEDLFNNPCHPIHRRLASVLTPDPSQGLPQVHLGIEYPNPIDPPSGCTFHPRCVNRREKAITRAEQFFDDGSFFQLLSRRVAINTGSRTGDRKPLMMSYLEEEMIPSLENIDFECRIVEKTEEPALPF